MSRSLSSIKLLDSTGSPITTLNPLPTTATISGDINVDAVSVDTGGLIGKASGTNADFTTTYTGATSITVSGLPTYASTLTDKDIETVKQINSGGLVVATYTRDDSTITVTGGGLVVNVASASFAASDTFVIYTNINRRQAIFNSAGNQVNFNFIPPVDFKGYNTGGDFQVAYTSNVTITLSNLPFTINDDSQLVYIRFVPSSGTAMTFRNGHDGVTMRHAAGVITISGAGTPFAAADKYEVGINDMPRAYDKTTDVNKSSIQAADWGSKNIDPITLISAAQTLTTSFADLGGEIPTLGYKVLTLWVKCTVQQSTGIQFQTLALHTSAGTEEYSLPISTVASTLTSIAPDIIQVPNGSNFLYAIPVEINNSIPYIQFQTKMTTDGGTDGTIDTAYYTLGY